MGTCNLIFLRGTGVTASGETRLSTQIFDSKDIWVPSIHPTIHPEVKCFHTETPEAQATPRRRSHRSTP